MRRAIRDFANSAPPCTAHRGVRYARGAELLTWPVALAIAVTAINDHVLKAAWPGVVTGKISDFSGLFFFPFLITALCGSPRWIAHAAVATAIVFTALKMSGLEVGPFRVVADPTDLLALVSPLGAVAYARWRWPCAV